MLCYRERVSLRDKEVFTCHFFGETLLTFVAT